MSAHKLGGPEGGRGPAGAEPADRAAAPRRGKEQDRRSGTHDVGGAVGLAVALRRPSSPRGGVLRVGALRDRLADGLGSRSPEVTESVPRASTLPGHRPRALRRRGSGGAARPARPGRCARGGRVGVCQRRGRAQPRPAGHGPPPAEARTGVRFTLGFTTTTSEVDHAVATTRQRSPPSGRELTVARARWQTRRMRVLVAMSGGVDSSVAAARLAGGAMRSWARP